MEGRLVEPTKCRPERRSYGHWSYSKTEAIRFIIFVINLFVIGCRVAAYERLVNTEEGLYTALADPVVTAIQVVNSISISKHRTGAALPLHVTRNVLVTGPESASYPRLDFTFARSNRVKLAPGVAITFRRLILSNIFSHSHPGCDFFASSDVSAALVWEQVVEQRALCPPLQDIRARVASLPRPQPEPEAAAVELMQSTASSVRQSLLQLQHSLPKQQQQLEVVDATYCVPVPAPDAVTEAAGMQTRTAAVSAGAAAAAAAPGAAALCWAPYLHSVDVAVESPAGYRLQWNDSVTVCDDYITQDCVSQLGLNLCYVTSMEALLADLAHAELIEAANLRSDPGSGSSAAASSSGLSSAANVGDMAGSVVGGVLLLALLAFLCVQLQRRRAAARSSAGMLSSLDVESNPPAVMQPLESSTAEKTTPAAATGGAASGSGSAAAAKGSATAAAPYMDLPPSSLDTATNSVDLRSSPMPPGTAHGSGTAGASGAGAAGAVSIWNRWRVVSWRSVGSGNRAASAAGPAAAPPPPPRQLSPCVQHRPSMTTDGIPGDIESHLRQSPPQPRQPSEAVSGVGGGTGTRTGTGTGMATGTSTTAVTVNSGGGGSTQSVSSAVMALLRSMVGRGSSNPPAYAATPSSQTHTNTSTAGGGGAAAAGGGGAGGTASLSGGSAATTPPVVGQGSGGGGSQRVLAGMVPASAAGPRNTGLRASGEVVGVGGAAPSRGDQQVTGGSAGSNRPSIHEIQREVERMEGELMRKASRQSSRRQGSQGAASPSANIYGPTAPTQSAVLAAAMHAATAGGGPAAAAAAAAGGSGGAAARVDGGSPQLGAKKNPNGRR